MSKLDTIAALIGLLAVLYLPINIFACRASYRAGVRRGQQLGREEACPRCFSTMMTCRDCGVREPCDETCPNY